MKCKTKADLHREYARVLDMCEGTNVSPNICVDYDGSRSDDPMYFDWEPELLKFAIAIVEDKPVFVGDTLYFHHFDGSIEKIIIDSGHGFGHIQEGRWSWNPPKKKTFTLNGKELPLPDESGGRLLRIADKDFWFMTNEDRDAVREAIFNLLDRE